MTAPHAHTHTHTHSQVQQGACVNRGRYMAAGPFPGSVGFGDFTHWFPGPVSPLSPVKKRKKEKEERTIL